MRPKQSKGQELTIDAAAQLLRVSTASIRNWIKSGYLKQASTGLISNASIQQFQNNVAGKDKLTARANKSQRDTHDHSILQAHFQKHIATSHAENENIGTQYENALSNTYRNKEGIYYTPSHIVNSFFSHLPLPSSKSTFCDPCCGSGNFIMGAIQHGISPENIYGFDTDPIAVALTQKRIFDKTGYQTHNIIQADFLGTIRKEAPQQFDIIVTNPPWGKKLTAERKKFYAKILDTGKSSDTCALFFFASLQCLSPNGHLGLLLPEAFFTVGSFESARQKALSLTMTALIDFGKPFKTLLTKAKGIVIKNHPPNHQTRVLCETHQGKTSRDQNAFARNPKNIFNISITAQESKVIEHLFSCPHLTLSVHAQFGLGIVTGNNNKYCSPNPKKGYIPVYKGKDVHKDHLTEPTTFIPADLSGYHQVAPQALYQAKEKLMYRFISSHLVFYYDTDQHYFLNSVNMLVLNNTFPINTQQLWQILNSTVINWLFQSLFETHKVLRSDIAALPIHTGYFDIHSQFEERNFLNYLGIEKHHDGFTIKKNTSGR